ncbi:MAG TPA: 50S ribosomal protein L29 [Egibacteraceae bacterium]|nr:50S ribosomal protein L29 [Egibacteraceae bacterium]
MDASQLRELSDAELVEKFEEHKEELFNLRFRMATGQLDNFRRLKEVRHDIARVLTVQRERELAAAPTQAEVQR